MKVLFLTTRKPTAQGDYLELTLVHGFRALLGDDFVEYPKKKILYGDFSESPREKLHGKGFTFCTEPIPDTNYDRNNLKLKDFDVVIHGSGFIYGDIWHVDHPKQFWTDGNDLYGNANRKIFFQNEHIIGTQYTENCFKRELVEEFPTVWPIGFGIPVTKLARGACHKKNLFQSTAPSAACFFENSAYKFDNERDYYDDMCASWFGLTCKKGGWDCLRHYEILASGSLLLFRDYDKKPPLCEPIGLPTVSYSNRDELEDVMRRYVTKQDNGILFANKEYFELLQEQQKWLHEHGTTYARALQILEKIEPLI